MGMSLRYAQPMRLLLSFLLMAATAGYLRASDESAAAAVVQRAFDGIAAHDGDMIRSTMLPDAMLFAVRDDGAPVSVSPAQLIDRISTDKTAMLERFTGSPRVLVHGRIAQVWGEYEFLHEGKLSHCGVDSIDLFRTPDGW